MSPRPTATQRVQALAALRESQSPPTALVAKALKDRSPRVRAEAVYLVQRHHLIQFREAVESFLLDRNMLLRTESAVCMGDLLEATATPHLGLRKLLQDSHWVVRIDAMESLQRIEDNGAVEEIASLLSDEHGVVRSYCASIVAEMAGQTYKPILLDRLRFETDPRAMVGLLAGLFLLGEKKLLPRLLAFLNDTNYSVRCAVIHSFERLDLSRKQRDRVIRALKDLASKEPTRAVTSTIEKTLTLL